jgi:hypothetical protein
MCLTASYTFALWTLRNSSLFCCRNKQSVFFSHSLIQVDFHSSSVKCLGVFSVIRSSVNSQRIGINLIENHNNWFVIGDVQQSALQMQYDPRSRMRNINNVQQQTVPHEPHQAYFKESTNCRQFPDETYGVRVGRGGFYNHFSNGGVKGQKFVSTKHHFSNGIHQCLPTLV